ncbi:hypothetical protein C8T65DRAFT_744167 [Cerioporus squamosus]|nr:hypothetical protein C8T65DRAFT_744167 [Cerioporus squamosus]
MSSDDTESSAAAIVALFNQAYTAEYCDMAASVIFLYEVIVTFDREVACFWTARKRGLSALLFLANKWITVTVSALTLAQLASFSSVQRFVSFFEFPSDAGHSALDVRSCTSFSLAGTAMSILQNVPGAVFSALRGYVLSRSKLLGLIIIILSLAPVGANLAQFGYHISGELFPPFGCAVTDETTESIDLKRKLSIVLSSRVPLIIADVLVIYITWTKLSSRDTLRGVRQSKRLSLSDILLRGGTIYFIALFILNVLHLILSVNAVVIFADGGSYITTFTAPITAILISRFLLELQEADQVVVRLDADDPLHSSRNPYDDMPSFISSLGGFINPDLPAASEDESDSHVGSCSDEEGGAQARSQSAASLSAV